MANIKDFKIEFTAPFNIMQSDPMSGQRDGASPILLRLGPALLSPTMYVRHETHFEKDVPNEHGGWTALYRWKVYGMEALSYQWFDVLREELLQEPMVTVHEMTVVDVENLEVAPDGHR